MELYIFCMESNYSFVLNDLLQCLYPNIVYLNTLLIEFSLLVIFKH